MGAKSKRARGTGSIKKVEGSPYWYIWYRVNGRQIRESSKSTSKMVAEKLLQRRLGEAGLGVKPEQDVKNIHYEEIRDALIAEYRNQGKASLRTRADGSEDIDGLDHLDKFFKGMSVTRIDTNLLRKFIEARRTEGAADGTILQNLSLLRIMLNRARKEGKLRFQDIPYFPMPKAAQPRKGFVAPDVFDQLLKALPEKLRPLIAFLYFTGCRLGAAEKITWDMINRDATEIELPGTITKNGEPLTLPLVGKGLEQVATMLRKMFRTDGSVFCTTNLRREWCGACMKLGLGVYDKRLQHYKGLTIHDLRRSAVRNLIRAGVSRGVAMSISGHKKESIFERYNITDTADVRDALVKVGEYATARKAKQIDATSIQMTSSTPRK